MTEGTLFVVATPIGNLDDMSPRAREVLNAVDVIAAEDTRVTGRLLSHFGIKRRQIAFHEHNEERQLAKLLKLLRDGQSVALVSDAGTPLVSDPGFRLLRAVQDAGIRVSPIPGPSALLTALSASGLATDRFVFEGFLPSRGTARAARLAGLADETRTLVFFESVHRVRDTLRDLVDAFGGDRRAFIGRELTKLHEQCVAADLDALLAMTADGRIPVKGEFVIATAGAREPGKAMSEAAADRLLAALMQVLPDKQAVEVAADASGESRNALYRRMLALKSANAGDNS